jgi:hypothetical protein
MSLAICRLTEGSFQPAADGATAFAISDTVGLTAFHCVGDRITGQLLRPKVRLAFRSGFISATVERWDARLDVALLRFDDKLPREEFVVPVSDEVGRETYWSRGFPVASGGYEVSISGQIVDTDARLFEPQVPALQLHCDQSSASSPLPLGGFSGAPILVGDPPRAVGVVRWNPPSPDNPRLALGATVYGTPMAAVLELWDEVVLGTRALRPSLDPSIKVRTQRTEYPSFLLFNPRTCEIPGIVPEYSYVHYEHGLVAVVENPSIIGVGPEEYTKGKPPHVASGEIFIDFTILNEGPATVVVSSIELEIMEVLDLPAQSLPGSFAGILEAIEDSVVISSEHSKYRLFRGKTLAYRSGEVDLLRVSVLTADDSRPCVFMFRFNVYYPDPAGSERVVHSDTHYLANCHAGSFRSVQGEENISDDRQPVPPVEQAYGISGLEREDFWTDGAYYNYLLEYSKCEGLYQQDAYEYLVSNFEVAVVGGSRDDIQKYGFERFKTGGPTGGPFNEVYVPVNPSQGRGYRSEGHVGINIYDGRDTQEYDCLLLACKNLSETGTAERKVAASRFLINQIQSAGRRSARPFLPFFRNVSVRRSGMPKLDVAGVVDTIALLAFFRNELSYDYLVALLGVEHELVLAKVSVVFNSVRYRKSADPLLAIVRSPRSYATLPALSALCLNGHPTFVSEIIGACDGERLMEDDANFVAEVLIRISEEAAKEFAYSHSASDATMERLLSFHIFRSLEGL